MSPAKQLKVYLHTFYYTFLTILAYPYELVITFVEPTIEVGFLALFWSIVAKAGGQSIDFSKIIAYFILVEAVSIWTLNPGGLNFANYLGYRIKTGSLSETLIRPVHVLRSLLFESRGYYGVDYMFSICLFFIAIKLSGSISAYQIFWFVIFLTLSFFITMSICVLLGSFAFITKEINSIRHSISHLIKILAGSWVPLSFFPERVHHLLNYTPFPSMMFAPINILQQRLPLNSILFDLRISLIWAVILLTLSYFIWKNNLKKYEATGI